MAEICPFDVQPLAVPRFVNNLPVYSLNYTNQDYHSIKRRMIELLRANFGDEFSGINDSSLAMMLIDCWAGMADMLSFKIDQIANEIYMDTVTELENAVRIARWVGFKPTPPLPAKAMFVARINNVFTEDLVLKTPILLDLDGMGFDIAYELYAADANSNPVFDTNIVIPAGAMFTEAVVGVEGRTRTSTFKSNGKTNQMFTLSYENVFLGAIKVKVNGTSWTEVDHFTEIRPKPEYTVEYDAYYKPTIIFGDNKAGLVPPPGAEISVKFRVPNKATAEIISGAFDTKVFASLPGISNNVIVNVRNFTKSEFGYPGDSIKEIKKKLPAYIRTQNRAVTGADYKYLVDSFATPYDGAIGKSNVVLRNHGCAGNIIDVIILAKTGDHRLVKANDNLKTMLLNYLDDKRMFTDYLCVKDGEITNVDITIDVVLDKNYKNYETEVKNKIVENLEDYFSLAYWEFGKSFKEKDMIKALSSIKEVKQFDISFTTDKSVEYNKGTEDVVTAKYNEVLRPDNISINFTYEGDR